MRAGVWALLAAIQRNNIAVVARVRRESRVFRDRIKVEIKM
jgi:hypothetical protein